LNLSRQILHTRHRLSHQQIDHLLDEETQNVHLPVKLNRLKKLGFFLQVTNELQEKGIWFMIIKGPLLSQRIYNDPTHRMMRDFDVLVDPEEIGRVITIFEQNGYKSDAFEWPQSKKKQEIARSLTNQYLMRNPDHRTVIELHWHLFTVKLTDSETLTGIIESNLEKTTFNGNSFWCFTKEFELLYLIIHGGIHAWNRLKWLLDIHQYLASQEIDFDKFNDLVSKLHARRFVDVCNVALQEYFPEGRLLPGQKTDVEKAGNYVLRQIQNDSGDPKVSLAEKITETRYKMSLSPRLAYKLSLIRVFGASKNDLNYQFLPPFKIFFFLFRPFGYLHRLLK
jgi:hypothetical protein